SILCLFYLNDTAPTDIYPLSLHDALPIYQGCQGRSGVSVQVRSGRRPRHFHRGDPAAGESSVKGRADQQDHVPAERPGAAHRRRSEEHTSELQSLRHLVCRLLLEKKNHIKFSPNSYLVTLRPTNRNQRFLNTASPCEVPSLELAVDFDVPCVLMAFELAALV